VPGNKKVRVFAGPNGSGKSTLFDAFSKEYNTGFFVNADRLEKSLVINGYIDLSQMDLAATQADLDEFLAKPSSISLIAKAAANGHKIEIHLNENKITDGAQDSHTYEGSLIAAFIRFLMAREDRSFSFETVMSDPSKVGELEALAADGYRVYLYFVCIDDPEINISRVQNRVAKDGHDVPAPKIEGRYFRTLEQLHLVLPLCYRAYLFDNSGKTSQMVAEQHDGELKIRGEVPKWFLEYVYPHYPVIE
jgi:predicted ABC-type ATPase